MKNILLSIGAATMLFAANAQTDCGSRYRDSLFVATKVADSVTYSLDAPSLGFTAQALDVYAPQGDTVTSRPLIVLIHSGGFVSKSKNDPVVVNLAKRFAQRGYVTASINYDLYPGSTSNLIDSLKADSATLRASSDSKAAIRFLRENASTYNFDTNKVYMVGDEAGAIVALNSIFLDTISKADPILTGIINGLGSGHGLEGNGGHYGYSSKVQVLAELGGGILHTEWIDGSTNVPTLLVQADNNQDVENTYLVPYLSCSPPIGGSASYNLCGGIPTQSALQSAGIANSFYTFEGMTDLVPTGGEPWQAGSGANFEIVDSLIKTFFFPYAAGCTPSGIKTIENEKLISVYPNPAQNVLNIAVENNGASIQSVRMFNVLGQTAYSGSETKISTQAMQNGIYFVEVTFKDNQRAVKRVEIAK